MRHSHSFCRPTTNRNFSVDLKIHRDNVSLKYFYMKKSEMTLTKVVDQTSILNGDRSKLKDLLRLRLTECGWNDEVRLLCREIVKEQGGNINIDKIVQTVTPQARVLVPDCVKKELLQKIKTILQDQMTDV